MGTRSSFPPEKLVVGVLSTRIERMGELRKLLEDRFGPADWESSVFDFTFTDYYVPEMGEGIKRYFISFSNLVDPETLADIKIFTNSVETQFMEDGKRKVNLDPGIISVDRFILATTKNRGHRVPLRKGIYAEITLIYMNKNFQELPWTYADFRSMEYRNLLKELRRKYLLQLREQH